MMHYWSTSTESAILIDSAWGPTYITYGLNYCFFFLARSHYFTAARTTPRWDKPHCLPEDYAGSTWSVAVLVGGVRSAVLENFWRIIHIRNCSAAVICVQWRTLIVTVYQQWHIWIPRMIGQRISVISEVKIPILDVPGVFRLKILGWPSKYQCSGILTSIRIYFF
jgi:hypothetical protein